MDNQFNGEDILLSMKANIYLHALCSVEDRFFMKLYFNKN